MKNIYLQSKVPRVNGGKAVYSSIYAGQMMGIIGNSDGNYIYLDDQFENLDIYTDRLGYNVNVQYSDKIIQNVLMKNLTMFLLIKKVRSFLLLVGVVLYTSLYSD